MTGTAVAWLVWGACTAAVAVAITLCARRHRQLWQANCETGRRQQAALPTRAPTQPAIDTQPGTNTQWLTQCQAIWPDAPATREEDQQ